jgi:hypothetical protein
MLSFIQCVFSIPLFAIGLYQGIASAMPQAAQNAPASAAEEPAT